MDIVDKNILKLIQKNFPVTTDPYSDLAKKLHITRDEFYTRLKALYETHYIVKITPKFPSNSNRIKALIALKVEPGQEDKIATQISALNEVSHIDLREHEYKLWFTLSAVDDNQFTHILNKIRTIAGTKKMIILPTKKMYKLNLEFEL